MRPIALTALLAFTATSNAYADCTRNVIGICQPNWETPQVAKDFGKIAQDAVDTAISTGSKITPTDVIRVAFPGSIAINEAIKSSGEKHLVAAIQNIEMIGTKLDRETQTAIVNALTSPDKAIRDASRNLVKAANDSVDAVSAAARYAEREISGVEETLTKAEMRLREGKVVDAMWHIGTDHLNSQNTNAATLMQESEVARQAAQALASSYGGPAGSAAFSAWMTYNASGKNFERAMLSGIYTYATASGKLKINEMPNNTLDETVKKAATTAAMRGIAVAAAGGTQQDILDSAVQGGGSVIVQSGNAYITKTYIDPAKSKQDMYCMNATGAECADAMQWVDQAKERLEKAKKTFDEAPTTLISTDGQWVVSWDREAIIGKASSSPGLLLSYVGKGSMYRKAMTEIASFKSAKPEYRPLPPKPKLHKVVISNNGSWINNVNFGDIAGYSSSIDISVDDDYIQTHYTYNAFETISLELTAGSHVMQYSVDMRSTSGLRVKDDCVVKFNVKDTEVFRPYIEFERVSKSKGIISKCALRAD